MARIDLRHRLARVHPFLWVGAAAIVAGLIAWPLGGWDTVELVSTRIPEYGAGVPAPGKQFTVAVDTAELTDVHPDGFSETEPGWQYLIVNIEITNETDRTEPSSGIGSDYRGVITLDDGVAGFGTTNLDSTGYLGEGRPYLVTDDTFLPDLQPGLAVPLRLVFEIPVGTWNVGDVITAGIIDRHSYASTLSAGTTWGFPELIGTVKVPVGQGPFAPLEEPVEDPVGEEGR